MPRRPNSLEHRREAVTALLLTCAVAAGLCAPLLVGRTAGLAGLASIGAATLAALLTLRLRGPGAVRPVGRGFAWWTLGTWLVLLHVSGGAGAEIALGGLLVVASGAVAMAVVEALALSSATVAALITSTAHHAVDGRRLVELVALVVVTTALLLPMSFTLDRTAARLRRRLT